MNDATLATAFTVVPSVATADARVVGAVPVVLIVIVGGARYPEPGVVTVMPVILPPDTVKFVDAAVVPVPTGAAIVIVGAEV